MSLTVHVHYGFQEGGAWYAVIPKIPAWEAFPLSVVLDCCASKHALESQFVQQLSLFLNVEIRECRWEVETATEYCTPKNYFSI